MSPQLGMKGSLTGHHIASKNSNKGPVEAGLCQFFLQIMKMFHDVCVDSQKCFTV